jgi:hypothetical protein
MEDGTMLQSVDVTDSNICRSGNRLSNAVMKAIGPSGISGSGMNTE